MCGFIVTQMSKRETISSIDEIYLSTPVDPPTPPPPPRTSLKILVEVFTYGEQSKTSHPILALNVVCMKAKALKANVYGGGGGRLLWKKKQKR